MVWQSANSVNINYTKEINIVDLPSDNTLQTTPVIFQKKINKAFELRITFFGDYAITAKIRSQEHPKGVNDWRYIPPYELKIE